MDTPILLVHISGGQATRLIRDAQTRLLPVYGETCPQYLFLLADSMKKDGFEGEFAIIHLYLIPKILLINSLYLRC
jgi:dihydroorotase-like cyclic amidohydrolase